MGLAASQARLLSITSRLADNELRSQTINNAKMRLSSDTAQASEDYLNALNNATLMFSNYDVYGNSQEQLLTFNSLMGYSPYNNQYGLINSSGQILVSEADAAAYEEAHGDLNTFLENKGLVFDTTYFEHLNVENFKDFDVDYAVASYFYGMEDEEILEKLQEMYEESESYQSSAEYNEFYDAYNTFSSLYTNVQEATKTAFINTMTATSNEKITSSNGKQYSLKYQYGKFSFVDESGNSDNKTPDQALGILYEIINPKYTGSEYGWSAASINAPKTVNGKKTAGYISDDVFDTVKNYLNTVYQVSGNSLFSELDMSYLDSADVTTSITKATMGALAIENESDTLASTTSSDGKITFTDSNLPGLSIQCDSEGRIINVTSSQTYYTKSPSWQTTTLANGNTRYTNSTYAPGLSIEADSSGNFVSYSVESAYIGVYRLKHPISGSGYYLSPSAATGFSNANAGKFTVFDFIDGLRLAGDNSLDEGTPLGSGDVYKAINYNDYKNKPVMDLLNDIEIKEDNNYSNYVDTFGAITRTAGFDKTTTSEAEYTTYTDSYYMPGLTILCDENNKVQGILLDEDYDGLYSLDNNLLQRSGFGKAENLYFYNDQHYTYSYASRTTTETTNGTTTTYPTAYVENSGADFLNAIWGSNKPTLDEFIQCLNFEGSLGLDDYSNEPYSYRNSSFVSVDGEDKITFSVGHTYTGKEEVNEFFDDTINDVYSYILDNINLDIFASNASNLSLPVKFSDYTAARTKYLSKIYDSQTKVSGANGNKYAGMTSSEVAVDLIRNGKMPALDFTSLENIMYYASAYGLTRSSSFETVIKDYIINDFMVAEFGEPSYSWQDISDKYNLDDPTKDIWDQAATDENNTINPNIKVTWYSNLFSRMQQGYKVLEDGFASSSEWLEFALESGTVSMEQVNTSNKWVSLDYKSCTKITEKVVDDKAVAIAEAKYTRAMNDIQAKDQIYDLQLKNLDTEHSALQTEYDSIKSAMTKNIERTMKFDQNG